MVLNENRFGISITHWKSLIVSKSIELLPIEACEKDASSITFDNRKNTEDVYGAAEVISLNDAIVVIYSILKLLLTFVKKRLRLAKISAYRAFPNAHRESLNISCFLNHIEKCASQLMGHGKVINHLKFIAQNIRRRKIRGKIENKNRLSSDMFHRWL